MGMMKQIFGSRPTTRTDVFLAAGAAVMAVIHFVSVRNEYKSEQEIKNQENNA